VQNWGNKKDGALSSHLFVEIPGFEPGQTEPKSVVLPLHHISKFEVQMYEEFFNCKN
jgi:hypothetical protein